MRYSRQYSHISFKLEVPPNTHYNYCMMNKKEIKYKQLLDLEWAINSNMIKAQSKYDEMYQEYGKKDKDDLLTELAYGDLKLLREANKTLKRVIEVMRDKELYSYA